MATDPQHDAGTQDGRAESVARAFHEAYETLAPEFGYRTREASAKPWHDVPGQNRGLMTATVQRLLDGGVIAAGMPEQTVTVTEQPGGTVTYAADEWITDGDGTTIDITSGEKTIVSYAAGTWRKAELDGHRAENEADRCRRAYRTAMHGLEAVTAALATSGDIAAVRAAVRAAAIEAGDEAYAIAEGDL